MMATGEQAQRVALSSGRTVETRGVQEMPTIAARAREVQLMRDTLARLPLHQQTFIGATERRYDVDDETAPLRLSL